MGKQQTPQQDYAERRDVRNAKDEPRDRSVPAKKNTKEWCGGKEGRGHKLQVFPRDPEFEKRFKKKSGYVLQCIGCGKKVDTFYNFMYERRKLPAWVVEHEAAGG